MMRRYRAALLGYYGFGNLGDELLLESCIGILEKQGISREKIIVLSNSPNETSESFHVDSINRWKIREVIHAFRNSDALMLGGGGLFQDSTSVKSCVWYWGIVRLARLFGCKVIALGQSFGPLKSKLSLMLTRNALNSCSVIHVRDEPSYKIALTSKCRSVTLGGDIVMTLKPETLTHRNEYMIVNLRPCSMVDNFIRIITPHLIQNNIKGAALSDEDIEPLERIMNQKDIVRVKSFHDAQELWQGASSAIGMRLHFGVLSRIFRVPLALMPYDVKVSEFAKQSGVPCIIDSYREPVMPREIPDDICSEIISL
jgi:polysaccharide pyruvyl transferase CsaB